MLHGNQLLADWITNKIGDGWITDLAQIGKLKAYVDDEQARKSSWRSNTATKSVWQLYQKHNGIEVDPNSIFDVQVTSS